MARLPPLRQLDANALVSLDLLLQEKSVSRAARRQGVTQSAMSQTLRRLRNTFNDDLLVRSGSEMLLTPRATALRAPLHQVLSELERVLADEPDFSPATSARHIPLGVSDYAAALLLPGLLKRLGREAPHIDLRIVPGGPRIWDDLRDGTCDLFVGIVPPRLPGTEHHLLWNETFVLAARRSHPITRARNRLEAFIAARHLLVSPGGAPGSRVDDLLAKRRRSRRVVATVPYFLAAPAIVAETDLVVTLPRKIAERFAPQLRILPHPLDVGSFDAGMAWPQRLSSDPAHRWLRTLITAIAATI